MTLASATPAASRVPIARSNGTLDPRWGCNGPVTLLDGTSIATDASQGSVFQVTLGGNRTLANPTNLYDGCTYIWIIRQDATGGRTLAYGSYFTWPGGTIPTIGAAANAVSIISAVYDGTAGKLRAAVQNSFA